MIVWLIVSHIRELGVGEGLGSRSIREGLCCNDNMFEVATIPMFVYISTVDSIVSCVHLRVCSTGFLVKYAEAFCSWINHKSLAFCVG